MPIFTNEVIIDAQPITVDGSAVTQPVSGTVAVSAVSGTVTVDGSGVTQPVSGSVAVSAVSGTVTVDGSGVTQPVSGSVSVSAVAGTVTVDGSGVTQPVSGSISVSNFPATQPVSGSVSVSNFPATQPVSIATMPSTPVTGTFWQTTQPVSGTFWQTTQPVSGTVSVIAGGTATATVNRISVTNTGASTLSASNAAKIKVIIYNEGGTLYVKFGATASSTDFTYVMTVDSTLEVSEYYGIITARKSSGTTFVDVTEVGI
jgi:hypothetical protein